MRVLSNLAVKKLCFCSLLFPSAGRKWNIAGTNVRSEPLSFVKSAGGAPGTRALVPGVLIENYMAKIVCLHDYQEDIIQRLSEEWRTRCSVMVQMPTGTGKTHVLAAVVSSFLTDGKRTVWIVAHRRELVEQIEETVAKYGTSLTDGRIRVMSIQWLTRHYNDVVEKPELVIIDEAHHAQARTYRMLWSKFPEAKFLGLTATPCRMGRTGFTDLFDSLVCSWSVAEFIRKGWLSSFDYVSIRANSREQRLIDSLEKRGADGDYQIREMNDVLNRHTSIERLYRSVLEYADGKKGIVYAVSIDHARNIAAYYSGKGLDAAAIDSHTPTAERGRMVGDFKTGRIQVLVNVDVFSEGFDCPDVEFVQMARPTLSLAKYLQQAGRGLRKSVGKETCVLIDNVGLYRVFGLPTMAWDWEAMFRGDMAGKGIRTVRHGNGTSPETVTAEDSCQDFGMEVIVSHDSLLSVIALQKTPNPCKSPELKAWQDRDSGLWGLRRGRKKMTDPVFVTVFDIRHDMAAVRFVDKNCGLVNACGEIIRKEGHCLSMKFMRNNFLTVQKPNGRSDYIDLYNLRSYREKPEVRRFGDVEMLKVGRMYYSRTKNLYASKLNLSGGYIYDHKFYVAIFDYNASVQCYIDDPHMAGFPWGYACLLGGDHDSFYWIYRWLADGSIIVTDSGGKYYHVTEGGEKKYIGCHISAEEGERCLAEMERLVKRAREMRNMAESEKLEKRRLLLEKSGEAVPFRSGMKWGLKVGERITIPPIYRSVRPPIGRYCAVEKNYSQWGVIAIDGTMMIEPQYSDIEISMKGDVTGTKVSGNKVLVKLP